MPFSLAAVFILIIQVHGKLQEMLELQNPMTFLILW